MGAYTDKAPLMTSTYTKVGLGGAWDNLPKQTSSQNRGLVSASDNQERSSVRKMNTATGWHLGLRGAGNRTSIDSANWSEAGSSMSSDGSLKSAGNYKKTSATKRLKGLIEEKWERRNQRVSLYQAWQRKLPVTERQVADV